MADGEEKKYSNKLSMKALVEKKHIKKNQEKRETNLNTPFFHINFSRELKGTQENSRELKELKKTQENSRKLNRTQENSRELYEAFVKHIASP